MKAQRSSASPCRRAGNRASTATTRHGSVGPPSPSFAHPLIGMIGRVSPDVACRKWPLTIANGHAAGSTPGHRVTHQLEPLCGPSSGVRRQTPAPREDFFTSVKAPPLSRAAAHGRPPAGRARTRVAGRAPEKFSHSCCSMRAMRHPRHPGGACTAPRRVGPVPPNRDRQRLPAGLRGTERGSPLPTLLLVRGWLRWWQVLDSNQRRLSPTVLQPNHHSSPPGASLLVKCRPPASGGFSPSRPCHPRARPACNTLSRSACRTAATSLSRPSTARA
jgi:hypothetical protein